MSALTRVERLNSLGEVTRTAKSLESDLFSSQIRVHQLARELTVEMVQQVDIIAEIRKLVPQGYEALAVLAAEETVPNQLMTIIESSTMESFAGLERKCSQATEVLRSMKIFATPVIDAAIAHEAAQAHDDTDDEVQAAPPAAKAPPPAPVRSAAVLHLDTHRPPARLPLTGPGLSPRPQPVDLDEVAGRSGAVPEPADHAVAATGAPAPQVRSERQRFGGRRPLSERLGFLSKAAIV